LPRRAPQVVLRHAELYDYAAAHLGRDSAIDLLEFGVAHGHTMRAFISRFLSPDARFAGFDSFVGLPEPWQMHDRGAFSARGMLPAIDDSRVQFIKGWFQDTVSGFLAARSQWRSSILVHFDADLYSSTLFLLTTLWHYVPEYYFIMDDFIHDEIIAMHDFSKTYPVEIEFFAQTTGGGSLPNPDQVFGRIKRTGFRLPD
jgi:Macrocin-O-methyltransferase (TylF)